MRMPAVLEDILSFKLKANKCTGLRIPASGENQAWPHGTYCLITQTCIKISSLKINTFIPIKKRKNSGHLNTNVELDKN